MSAKKRIDYERIEAGWRAGLLSPRQLAALYTEETGDPVSHAAITRHFSKQGIPRNLSAKIMARSNVMVTEAMVTDKVTPETIKRDKEIIESAATKITEVRLGQRHDIQRSRLVTMALLAELECQTGAENIALLQQLGVLMRSEDDKAQDKLNDLYHKLISLPERAKTLKMLADSMRITIDLERQAFGMKDEAEAPADALASLLNKISGGNRSSFGVVAEDPEL